MDPSIQKKLKALFKGKWYLLLLALVGIALLLFSGKGTKGASEPVFDAEAYRAELSASVKELCERTEGVGTASVLLTLETGERAIYEKNLTEKGESVALSGGDAILSAYAYPAVAGVAVVCEGGDRESVRTSLTLLLSRALSLPVTKIYIAGAK